MFRSTLVRLIVAMLLGDSLAGARTRTGTIVVLGGSTDKIVVAVDSRTNVSDGRIDDSQCKITRLRDRNLLFISTGTASYYSPSMKSLSWDAEKIILKVNGGGGPKSIRGLATEWGESVAGAINEALRQKPDSRNTILREVDPSNDGIVAGLFLGVEDRTLVAFDNVVEYRFGQATPDLKPLPLTGQMTFGGFGKTRVVDELLAGKTPFAKAEAQRWQAEARFRQRTEMLEKQSNGLKRQ